jgi:hypothetical protein
MTRHLQLLSVAFAVCTPFHTSLASASCEPTPTQATQTFYNWYLKSFSDGRLPLSDDMTRVQDYVAPSLVFKIKALMNGSKGLDTDYFIKARDYQEDWLTHTQVSTAKMATVDEASVHVILGNSPETIRKLSVSLGSDGSCWRIKAVTA